jgi:hypothetical protein
VLSGHGHAVRKAEFSPDGRRIVTASFDQTVRIWDAAAGKQLAELAGHEDSVWDAAWSPDGTRIVSAAADQTARVWDAATGRQIAVLSGHSGTVRSVAFSPDGRRIVTASEDQTARIWDAVSGVQLAVLAGHLDMVWSAAWSPDGQRIVTTANDRSLRIWDARIPADLDAQIAWSQAAQTDVLSRLERSRLGLPPDTRIRTWPADASKCDAAAAAPYDPDRSAPGVVDEAISVDVASNACTREIAASGTAPRVAYQLGRALVAKHDLKAARREFETAISLGYRAARIDLADLLADASAGTPDPARAVALYEKAWQDGVPIAAFKLGRLNENGLPAAVTSAQVVLRPDGPKAWSWYRKGADVGEPNALARLAERDEASADTERSPEKRHALLIDAFSSYASAAEHAEEEGWPDEAWRHWRYRRSTLAHLLAREGMMRQVADAYIAVRGPAPQSH